MRDNDKQHPAEVWRARELRNRHPKAEVVLWTKLRGSQTGFKFRRQHPIGTYIVDFACVAKRLVVEIDGQSHDGRSAEDIERENTLNSNGWRVIRFVDDDVLRHLDNVVAEIQRVLTLDALT